ncbi:hypothetical protein ACJMK2_027571 [Sinanodonta woodiana]|uniref:Uncharacterized protein n=1 Tax=Sinanodonta woodiana TaxID=1069815 RepID=A0ABD3X879_SINWO
MIFVLRTRESETLNNVPCLKDNNGHVTVLIKRTIAGTISSKGRMVWNDIFKREDGLERYPQKGGWWSGTISSKGRMVWNDILKREDGLERYPQKGE